MLKARSVVATSKCIATIGSVSSTGIRVWRSAHARWGSAEAAQERMEGNLQKGNNPAAQVGGASFAKHPTPPARWSSAALSAPKRDRTSETASGACGPLLLPKARYGRYPNADPAGRHRLRGNRNSPTTFAAQHKRGVATHKAENFMCRRMVVVKIVNAIAPLRRPAVAFE